MIKKGEYRWHDLVIKTPTTLCGEVGVTIDVENNRGLFLVDADFVEIRGLTIKNVASSFVNDNAAIRIFSSRHCMVESNNFLNTFFGVLMQKSSECTVSNNRFAGKYGKESASGNGIHLWNCRDICVAHNTVTGHRDGFYFEFVKNSRIYDNYSYKNQRYGLHFMFSNDDVYHNNTFENNGAGVAVMYSKRVRIKNNTFKLHGGPASYGLLIKELFDSQIMGNKFIKNTVSLFSEGSTRILIKNNDFTHSGYAIKLLSNSNANEIKQNNFIGNTFDLSINNRHNTSVVYENFWSSYDGYDLNKDGIGDVPFYPVRLFSTMTADYPATIILLHSIFVKVLDLTERTVPILTPKHLVDLRPRMKKYPRGD